MEEMHVAIILQTLRSLFQRVGVVEIRGKAGARQSRKASKEAKVGRVVKARSSERRWSCRAL